MTTLKELAQATARAIREVAATSENDRIHAIHIFLQEDGLPTLEGRLWGVHCDQSFGGDDAAEEIVREALPDGLAVAAVEEAQEWEALLEEALDIYV